MADLVADINPSIEFYLPVDDDVPAIYFSAQANSSFVSGARIEIYPSGSPIALEDDWDGDDLIFGCFIYRFGPGVNEDGDTLTGLGHDLETYDFGYASTTGIFFWGPFSIQPFRVQGVGFPSGATATVTYEESVPDPGDGWVEENPSPPSIDADPFLAAPSNFLALIVLDAIGNPHVQLSWTDNSGEEDGFRIYWQNGNTSEAWQELVTLGVDTISYDDTYDLSVANALAYAEGTTIPAYCYRIFATLNAKRSTDVLVIPRRPHFTIDPDNGATAGGTDVVLTFTS